jgi:2-dehydropantoate 2-reductase
VVLTVPPQALRGPGFVSGVRAAQGEHGSVLALILGLGDERWLEHELGPGRLATAEIVLISYSPPLEGPTRDSAKCAYFLPPFAKAPLSGPQGPKLVALGQLLTRAGLPTQLVPNAREPSRLAAAVLFALVSALQLVGWRFAALGQGDALTLGLAAAREREALLTAEGAGPTPRGLACFSPRSMRLGVWLAARVLPLPLEAYLRVHFTKVNAQFVDDRARLLEASTRLNLPAPNLEALHHRLA